MAKCVHWNLKNTCYYFTWVKFNTLWPRQNGRHFPDDIFKRIFLNENVWISINISLKFVPMGQINNIPTLVQVMTWRRPGDKPLSEIMIVRLPTHICVTRPQWVKLWCNNDQETQQIKGFRKGQFLCFWLIKKKKSNFPCFLTLSIYGIHWLSWKHVQGVIMMQRMLFEHWNCVHNP